MVFAQVDEKARICITRELVNQYGEDFIIVPAKNEILLIPVSKNPLKALQEEGKKIPKGLGLKELKKMIREDAEKEALENMKSR